MYKKITLVLTTLVLTLLSVGCQRSCPVHHCYPCYTMNKPDQRIGPSRVRVVPDALIDDRSHGRR